MGKKYSQSLAKRSKDEGVLQAEGTACVWWQKHAHRIQCERSVSIRSCSRGGRMGVIKAEIGRGQIVEGLVYHAREFDFIW